MTTSAPSCAKRLAIAAPMPREPPVTSATLPESVRELVVASGMRTRRLRYRLRRLVGGSHRRASHLVAQRRGTRCIDLFRRADHDAIVAFGALDRHPVIEH